MKGTPRKPLYVSRALSNAASFTAVFLFILMVLYLYLYGSKRALGVILYLWTIYAGIVAFSIYPLVATYYSVVTILIREYDVEPLRPPFRPLGAAAAVLAVPFTAPLVVSSMNAWLLNIVEKIIVETGIDVDEVARELPSSITSFKPFIAGAILPILQPISILYSWRNLQLALCGLLRVLSRRGLWDKPCTPDFIEIMVWAKPNNLALNSKLLSEKWSIKD